MKDRVDDSDSLEVDLVSLGTLKHTGGPLDEITHALQQLIKKIAPGEGLVRKSRALLWPLNKAEVKDLIDIIERQKTAFNLAIENDNI